MLLLLDVHPVEDPVTSSDVGQARDADLRTHGPRGVSHQVAEGGHRR